MKKLVSIVADNRLTIPRDMLKKLEEEYGEIIGFKIEIKKGGLFLSPILD